MKERESERERENDDHKNSINNDNSSIPISLHIFTNVIIPVDSISKDIYYRTFQQHNL